MRPPKKHLIFGSLREVMSQSVRIVMSGLAMKYFQDRSLLQFQKHMEENSRRTNLQTSFGVKQVPKDTL